jgi:hypothetical protein
MPVAPHGASPAAEQMRFFLKWAPNRTLPRPQSNSASSEWFPTPLRFFVNLSQGNPALFCRVAVLPASVFFALLKFTAIYRS